MNSMINSVSKGKFSFKLKQYCKVVGLLKSYGIDIKKKANTFSADDINRFVNSNEVSSPYCMVKKVIGCLDYYGGIIGTQR